MARLLFCKGKCLDAAIRKEEKSCHRSLHKYRKTVVAKSKGTPRRADWATVAGTPRRPRAVHRGARDTGKCRMTARPSQQLPLAVRQQLWAQIWKALLATRVNTETARGGDKR